MEVFKLFGSILVDSDEANKSISKTGKETEGLGKKLGNGIKTAGKWALGVTTAAVGIGTAAFAMTKKVTGAFDDIAKNSRKMGVSTDYYQEMDYWASQNGLSHENMEKSMKRLNQRLGQAVDGNKKYSDALTRLGVDMGAVKDGTVSTEQAMTQSIQALSEMENSQEKAALAAELFGVKLAQELMPALDSGALSIEDAQKKAEELGIVIGEDSLNAAEAFNDAWDDITRSLTAVGQKVLAELMPVFKSMMDWVLANMPAIQAVMKKVFDVIGVIFGTAVEWIQSLISWLSEWRGNNEGTLSAIWDAFKSYLTFIIDYWKMVFETAKEVIKTVFEFISNFINTILEEIYNFWENYGEQLMESAINIFNSIKETVETVFNAIWEIIQEIINLVVPFIQKQLDRIKEFWEENGEQIMQAVQVVMDFVKKGFDFIKGIIDFIMPIIIAIIKGAWSIISSVFETVIGVIMGLVKVFSSLLTGDFEGIKEGLTKIWESLWDGIKGIVSGAWTLLSGAFGALWDNISGWFDDIIKSAFDWGRNMISGFVDGIKSMIDSVKSAVSNVTSAVSGFLGFSSPAKKGEGRFITEWGENMVSGFLDGVKNETNEAAKVMNNLISSMNPNRLNTSVGSEMRTNGTEGSNKNKKQSDGITQHITIISPEPTSPSENARKIRQASQRLAMEWR